MPIITDFGPTVQDYRAHFASSAFPRPEECPCCGASHTFIGHGYYLRQPKDQAQVYPIWLKRWFCKACHTTLSVLPSFLLRFRHYLLVVIQQVVVARFEDHASWQQTAQRCASAGLPGHSQVIALEPAFIMPQDGHEKQDCELRAMERWLKRNAHRFPAGVVTVLGDDLYAHQPFCELLTTYRWHFAFTCKPESHAALYQEIELLAKVGGVSQLTERHHNGARREVWQYRYATRLPLRADMQPLYVNWCEVTISDEATGERLYHNAWGTDHTLEAATLHPFVVAAGTRWKSENENNNVLKNYGYHLEHNFGHGQHYLALVLVMLNIFAFLYHTVLDLCDTLYRQVCGELVARQTFFNDIQALTRYLFFPSWQALLHFMAAGLELDTS